MRRNVTHTHTRMGMQTDKKGNLTRSKIGIDIYDGRPYVRRKFITQIE